MKIFLFILAATILEACGDSIVRIALHNPSVPLRFALFFLGGVLLFGYGATLNLAPTPFSSVVGFYVATLFVVFQITNFIFFKSVPSASDLAGGTLIVIGGLIVGIWK